jgi:dimethylargininase
LAIARQVPQSFASAITKYADDPAKVDLENAIQQHIIYLDRLRRFVPTLCLPAMDDLPDSIFVEDTVVAVGNKAIITNPGHPSRRDEVNSIQEVLSQQLGMDVTDMRDFHSGTAFCDGGDVLTIVARNHMFVGISERTNMKGAQVLGDALGIEAIPVQFEGNALHLKSIVTNVDDSTLLAPTGKLGDVVLEAMDAVNRGYTVVRLPSMLACNVVSVNGGLLAQDVGDNKSRRILEQVAAERNLPIEFVSCSEIAKVDGALTCCSVLLSL